MPSPSITKRALADAMKKFMRDRPLSKISVGDIVAECGLNRNSFYYHFKDKYDLVNWIFYTEFAAELGGEEVDSGWAYIGRILCFFYREKAFYLNALSESGQNTFSEYLMDLTRAAVLARLDEVPAPDEHRDFYVTFFIDAFMACILRWLREGAAIPPETLCELIRRAAGGAASALLWDEGRP